MNSSVSLYTWNVLPFMYSRTTKLQIVFEYELQNETGDGYGQMNLFIHYAVCMYVCMYACHNEMKPVNNKGDG